MSNKFLKFINDLTIEQNAKAALQQAEITEVAYSPERDSLEIRMNTAVVVDSAIIGNIEISVKKLLGIQNVAIIQSNEYNPTFREFCATPLQVLDNMPLGIAPVVWRALNASTFEVDNGRIKITVSNETVESMLSEHEIERKIRELLKKCPDCANPDAMEINICVTESDEYSDAIREDLLAAEAEARVTVVNTASNVSTDRNNPQILGKATEREPGRIVEILGTVSDDQACECVIAGRINSLESRKLQRGSTIVLFNVVDGTEAIRCKLFIRPNQKEGGDIAGRLKNGMNVKIAGAVKLDHYEHNKPVLEPRSIRALPDKEPRVDESVDKRVELHCHTKMSTLDAVVTAADIVKTAARWGHPAVAITDHGVVQSFPEAAAAAAKYNKAAKEKGSCHRIKVIFGMEGYLIPEGAENDAKAHLHHIIILARNRAGLKNLYKLVSDSHLKRYKKRPRLMKEDIIRYREGLIIGSACEAGELFQAVAGKADESKIARIAGFYDYFEIQPLANNSFMIRNGSVKNYQELQDINRAIVKLGDTFGKPVVATTDAHFLDPEDEVYRKIILAVKGMDDGSNPLPLYFRTTGEMLEEFAYLGEETARKVVVTNSLAIADSIEELQPIPTKLHPPKIEGSEQLIESMALESARKLYGDDLPQIIKDRLDFELKSIIGHNYAVLYNIAHKLVKKSNEDGYLVGSRGSVGSSFVATMCGITEVNPLLPHWLCPDCKHSEFVTDGSYANGFDLPDKTCACGSVMRKDGHNIPFAVFMGFEGDKVPDIDLNFSGEYQAKIHKYTEELLGKENVFRAGTISTIAEKNAIGFVKKYFEEKGVTASDAYISSFSEGCVGVKRTTGQHPGGLMVVPYDMDVCEITPVQHPAEAKDTETITTHFDYHSIHDALVKLDNLGHDVPTIIKDLKELSDVDPVTIPFDDPQTLSLFCSTDAVGLKPEDLLGSTVATFGVPEFGTKFVREMLKDTQPKVFSELVRISGFSHGTDVWLGNAKDLIMSKTAKVSEVISARDDIMIFLIEKGLDRKHAFTIMENVRKGKGLKEDDISAMKAAKVPAWYIDSCQKIKYLFPKAHAAAYVMMAFRIAWFKVFRPLAFYAASFSVKAEEFNAELICNGYDRLKKEYELIERKGKEMTGKDEVLMPVMELAMEMYLRGFEFLKVDLLKSHYSKFRIEDGKILPPLCSLAGLGANAAQNIVNERAVRSFTSIEDMQNRARINKTVTEVMRAHGCLDGLDETDQMTLF